MVGPIIVLPPSGCGFSGSREPAIKRPTKIYYRRYCPRTGMKHEFTWYVNKLADAEAQMSHQGHEYWMYGYDQDGELRLV